MDDSSIYLINPPNTSKCNAIFYLCHPTIQPFHPSNPSIHPTLPSIQPFHLSSSSIYPTHPFIQPIHSSIPSIYPTNPSTHPYLTLLFLLNLLSLFISSSSLVPSISSFKGCFRKPPTTTTSANYAAKLKLLLLVLYFEFFFVLYASIFNFFLI